MAHIQNQALLPGIRLGVYEIKEMTKADTLGITYSGFNHHLKEWVEIVEYFPQGCCIRASDTLGVELNSADNKESFEYGLKTFLDQAETLSQIDHPNIVSIENLLQFNGTAYLVFACEEGAPLAKLTQSTPSFSETQLTLILESVLDALRKVHEHSIVHGDIRPDTIIMDSNGEPLLTGFAGTRLALAAHDAKITSELALGYTAPELYGQVLSPTPASDFYALGATLRYCITHEQPIAAQNRIMVLSKGEADPMLPLSETANTLYSEALLNTIDWMLKPGYDTRPHSAAEILAFFESATTKNQAGAAALEVDAKNHSFAKIPLWSAAVAGLAALLLIGYWVTKKPSKTMDRQANTVAQSSPSVELGNAVESPSSLAANQDQNAVKSPSPTVAQSSTLPGQNQTASPTENKINEPEQQPKQTSDEMPIAANATLDQSKNSVETVSSPAAVIHPETKAEPKTKITPPQKHNRNKNLISVEKKTPARKQNLPANANHEGSVKDYLAAARKAMKEVRFTTPPGNNAYAYYQKVLAKDPQNAEAHAGLQRIVKRYTWFIKKSKSDGEIDRAKRVLKKAESVLPNDPKLQQLKDELSQ